MISAAIWLGFAHPFQAAYQNLFSILHEHIFTPPERLWEKIAMLSEIILAELQATIGFASCRVIEQALQEKLPDDFQTDEYLLRHGFVDASVPSKRSAHISSLIQVCKQILMNILYYRNIFH